MFVPVCHTQNGIYSMTGKKISKEHFKRNYTKVNPRDINAPINPELDLIRPEPEPKTIHKPITLKYNEIVMMTAKGVCIRFEKDGAEYWFSRALTRVNKRVKEVTLPKNFVEDRGIIDAETL